MVFYRCFVALTLAFGIASAVHISSPLVTHERRSHIPYGWSRIRKHDAHARLPLRIGLVQPNLENIEEYLMDVSHPDSENYGNHWTAGKVAATFAPSHDSVDAVRTWLEENGVATTRIGRMRKGSSWVEVDVSVEEAEKLLSAEYHVYEHESGKRHIACDSYHIPEHVQEHIDLITPTVHFDARIKRTPVKPFRSPSQHVSQGGKISYIFTDLENCDEQITPVCLRALYDIVYESRATHKNSFAIVEYTPQSYSQLDLDLFNTNFTPSLVGKSPNAVFIDGGQVQSEYPEGPYYNLESNVDFEYGMNLVAPLNVTLYQTGDSQEGATSNNLLDALDGSYCTFEGGDDPTVDAIYPDPLPAGYKGAEDCGTIKPAHVISTSITYQEADLTPFYTARQCAEYAKLGLMGVTVLYASGIYGVGGSNGLCLTPNGTQSADGDSFNPTFPSTCPYITSVGVTQMNPNSTVFDPEVAWQGLNVFSSSGGFSNHFARPRYQETAISEYLTKYPPPYSSSVYNASSRGFPDISINGNNYVIALDLGFELSGGSTTPVAGAILTLVNDARLAAGKRPIGFINPAIYSGLFNDAFNDIKSGNNPGCFTSGFAAVPGWDPVTGLGTPNFRKLVDRWLRLP